MIQVAGVAKEWGRSSFRVEKAYWSSGLPGRTLAWGKQPDRSVGFWEKACCSSRFLERMCGLAAEEEGCVVVGVKLFIGAVT